MHLSVSYSSSADAEVHENAADFVHEKRNKPTTNEMHSVYTVMSSLNVHPTVPLPA